MQDNPDCPADMESSLLPHPYPNEDAEVTRHRSALNARISAFFALTASAVKAWLTFFPEPSQGPAWRPRATPA